MPAVTAGGAQLGKTWIQAIALGAIVVVSMLFGGLLAVNVGERDAPAQLAATSPLTGPTTLPVSNVVTPTASAADAALDAVSAAALLPDVVDDVRRSVVRVDVNIGTGRGGDEGVGSGVIVDSQGHVLTNYHVIEGADEVSVELWDGTAALARVVGIDQANDLAVLRVAVQPQRLVPARFGDSDLLRLGQPVFAIGNPFALDFAVTSGIVSGLGRERQGLSGRPIRGAIQIDAAVNPGNSGGPLFNASGEVVGITTSIENPTGQRVFIGIGFAVPSNTALRFLPLMIAGEEVTHPQLGISGTTLNELNAASANLDIDRGVYLTSIGGGTAAEAAGLLAASRIGDDGALRSGGDVILAIDGTHVSSIEELALIIDGHEVGDDVTLTVFRANEEIEVVATLLEWQ